jgi:predicted secreted protein
MAMASFRNDRLGATNAIKRAIQHLLDADDLRELPRKQMQDTFGTGARAFAIANPRTFV